MRHNKYPQLLPSKFCQLLAMQSACSCGGMGAGRMGHGRRKNGKGRRSNGKLQSRVWGRVDGGWKRSLATAPYNESMPLLLLLLAVPSPQPLSCVAGADSSAPGVLALIHGLQPVPLSNTVPGMRLALRGGAGWLGDSSESAVQEDEAVAVAAEESSNEDSAPHSKYTLSATGLLDPSQYNVTDDVLDLFLRPPARPTTRDGKPLCGVGLLLSNTKPYKVEYIEPGSPADLSSKIFVGDVVVSMDGKRLADLSFDQILDLGLGFEGTILTLHVVPAEAQRAGLRGDETGPNVPGFTMELSRATNFLPWWTRPAADDPGGDGPEAEAWKNKTRAMLREALVGWPLADFGCWRKMKDRESQRTFYFDALKKRVQFEKPLLLQV
jgi:hypothetical protein